MIRILVSKKFIILLVVLGSLVVELLVLATIIPPTTRAYLYISLLLIVVGYLNVQVMRMLLQKQKRKTNTVVSQPTEKLLTSLAVAEKIQKYLLPANGLNLPGIEFYARSRPSEHISGDFYQVIALDESKTLIAIGDAAGHGLPSALVSIMVDTLLHAYAQEKDLERMLSQVNHILYQRIDPSLFSTLLVMVWDSKKEQMTLCSAGFGRIACFDRAKNALSTMKTGGVALGMIPHIGGHVVQQTFSLAPQDALILSTDGILDMRNPLGERLGYTQWTKVIEKHVTKESAEQIFNAISDDLLAFAGTAKQVDDITLMIIRRTC